MKTLKPRCGCIIKRFKDKESGCLIRTQQLCKKHEKEGYTRRYRRDPDGRKWDDLELA